MPEVIGREVEESLGSPALKYRKYIGGLIMSWKSGKSEAVVVEFGNMLSQVGSTYL